MIEVELKNIGRKISTLKGSRSNAPATPGDVLENARIDQALAALVKEQETLSIQYLEREGQRELKKQARLKQQESDARKTAKAILEKLPVFAEKLSIATKALGQEYTELHELSQTLKRLNSALLREGIPVNGCMHIEPDGLNKLIASQLRECFPSAWNTRLKPTYNQKFDIVESIKQIS